MMNGRSQILVLVGSIFLNLVFLADRWFTPDDEILEGDEVWSYGPLKAHHHQHHQYQYQQHDSRSPALALKQCHQVYDQTGCADSYPGYHGNRLTHLIIPVHTSQLGRLEANMKTWAEVPPCSLQPGHAASPNAPFHLVIYTSADARKRQNILELESKLESFVAAMPAEVSGCFASYEFQHANLSGPSDTYYRGTRLMIEKLILNKVKLQHPAQYAFYMEPDCLPIRPNWLNALDTSSRWPHQIFWLRGSIYRGNNKGVYATRHAPQVFHINGNALVNLFDRRFRSFYVKHFRPYVNAKSKTRERSFDTEFYRYMHDIDNIMVTRTVIHRFQYTEIVQNFWRSSYSLSKMKNDFPDTYFIHGGYPKQ